MLPLFGQQPTPTIQSLAPLIPSVLGAVGFAGGLGACGALRKLLTETAKLRVDLDGKLDFWHSVIVIWSTWACLLLVTILIVANLAVVAFALGHLLSIATLTQWVGVERVLLFGCLLGVVGAICFPLAKGHYPQLLVLRLLGNHDWLRFSPGWISASYQLQSPPETNGPG